MTVSNMELKDYVILRGVIRCVTGLRIGGPGDLIEIGGLDNPIIKHPLDQHPYIPGSSLKGKMRSLLEMRHGLVDTREKVQDPQTKEWVDNTDRGGVHRPNGPGCGGDECLICRIFGSSAGEGELGPSRLIVRDADPTSDPNGWMQRFKDLMEQGESPTERKWENTINQPHHRHGQPSPDGTGAGWRRVRLPDCLSHL